MKRPPIELILKKKNAADTYGYVNIRIGVPGTKRYEFKSTGYRVEEKNWNAETEFITKGDPEATIKNLAIHREKDRLVTELNNDLLQGDSFTKEHVRARLGGKDNRDLLVFFKEHLDYIGADRKSKNEKGKTKLSPNYIKKLRSEYHRLYEYSGGTIKRSGWNYTYSGGKLLFKQITVSWLEKYEQALSATLDAGTSLPVAMSKLMMILSRADGKGMFDMKSIASYHSPIYKNPQRPYLTIDQLDSIEALLYGGSFDGSEELKVVAAFFLIECYSGIRQSDWSKFSVEKLVNNESLRVGQTQKTGEPIYIPLSKFKRLKKVLAYIKKNKLVFDYSNQHTNRCLKLIATAAKIPICLTSHVGRHTAATLLLELGWSLEAVAQVLGVSMKTIEIYAKVTRRKVVNEAEKYGGL